MKIARNFFYQMVSIENLLLSWDKFKLGKRKRKDIQYFERYLEDFIFSLHDDLITFNYNHDPYVYFHVYDPKERRISKASVKDRLVHHILYISLTEIFDRTFIFHSLSCRLNKGIHLGIQELQNMLRIESLNGKRACFALKMDIRRFFDSVDHEILKSLIRKRVKDDHAIKLIDLIIDSFTIPSIHTRQTGLPLGNVTSQLFGNIYLHELDHFIKHHLRHKSYLRYCDDFVLVSEQESTLLMYIPLIRKFLKTTLFLDLHPQKIILKKLNQGIDFLGYITFFHHRLVRTSTRQRIKRKLEEKYSKYLTDQVSHSHLDQSLQSYLGILSHANQHDLIQTLKNAYWIRKPV